MEFAICIWMPDFTQKSVEHLQSEGVKAVEPGPAWLLQEDEMAFQADIQRLQSHNIRMYSCHSPFSREIDLSLLEDEKRTAAVAEVAKALARTAQADAGCMVVHAGNKIRPEEREQRTEQLKKSLETLLKEAEKTGVKLALENMPEGFLCDDATFLRDIVDSFDSPFLGVCLDTGHANLSKEGVASALGVLGKRIINSHLHDNDKCEDRHLQPPYGTIDWQELAEAIRVLSFTPPMAIEAPPWNKASWSLQLREMKALFEGQMLTMDIEGKKVRMVCTRCGHYCFGTAQDWFCGCH